MDKFFKKQLDVWTLEKIKSNPQKFGSDNSNANIMHEYANEFHADSHVMQLEPRFYSVLSTVSRIKNQLLEDNPQYDCRNKYKPKKRKTDEVH
jgi:hypothetical protein